MQVVMPWILRKCLHLFHQDHPMHIDQVQVVMKGADIVGAYLVTKNNPDYELFIHTPEGYAIGPDQVIKAVGNLYGAPPAGQNFSIEFDK
jgi:hypothetical protein